MNIIASADANWGIGRDNQLLIRIPEDMKQFRTLTTGNVVVMGRKTLKSFPNAKPLPNRTNIVLTRDASYKKEGVLIVHSIEELTEVLASYDTKSVFVIGGDSIYHQLEPLCDTAYITKIDYEYAADAHLPNLSQMDTWKLVDESEEQTYFDVIYTYQRYERV